MNSVKRALDIAGSIGGLIIVGPLMVVLSVISRLFQGGPVLFRQKRIGRNGDTFTILKFRTMVQDPAGESPSKDAARITRLGRLLRQSSVDELPELFNVVRGDMSLVGPRPLLPQYLERYTAEQARRHKVRPGITGWAQVNGRNAITWEEKLELDVWYVDNWSLGLDLKILRMTFVQVVKGRGVKAEGHATMPEFMGTRVEEDS